MRYEISLCQDCKTFVTDDELPDDRDREICVLAAVETLYETDLEPYGLVLLPAYEDGGEGFQDTSLLACECCAEVVPGPRYKYEAVYLEEE